MISLLPSSPPADTFGAYAILALIADADAAKKRLDALVAERQAAEAALAEARELNTKTAKDRAATDAQMADVLAAQHEHDALAKSVEARAVSLDAKETDLAAREAALAKNTETHAGELDERERAVGIREQAVTENEKAAADLMAQATALKADYEKRLASLRQVVG